MHCNETELYLLNIIKGIISNKGNLRPWENNAVAIQTKISLDLDNQLVATVKLCLIRKCCIITSSTSETNLSNYTAVV